MSPLAVRAVAITCTGCISWLGMDFRPAAVLAAVSAAFLVRVPLFKRTRLWAEASTTALGMLGAFLTTVDHHLAPGNGFWVGLMFGASASSLLEVGKAVAGGAIRDKLQAVARILLNMPNGGGSSAAETTAQQWAGRVKPTPPDMQDALTKLDEQDGGTKP